LPPKKSPKVAAHFAGGRLAANMTPDARSKTSMTLALDGARFSIVIACTLAIADWINAAGSMSARGDRKAGNLAWNSALMLSLEGLK
jgi:hypothetical protein